MLFSEGYFTGIDLIIFFMRSNEQDENRPDSEYDQLNQPVLISLNVKYISVITHMISCIERILQSCVILPIC